MTAECGPQTGTHEDGLYDWIISIRLSEEAGMMSDAELYAFEELPVECC